MTHTQNREHASRDSQFSAKTPPWDWRSVWHRNQSQMRSRLKEVSSVLQIWTWVGDSSAMKTKQSLHSCLQLKVKQKTKALEPAHRVWEETFQTKSQKLGELFKFRGYGVAAEEQKGGLGGEIPQRVRLAAKAAGLGMSWLVSSDLWYMCTHMYMHARAHALIS